MRDTASMTAAFELVVAGVALVGVLGALAALVGSRRTWEGYGRDHLLKDSDLPARRAAARGEAVIDAPAEREEEIRQLLDAANARRRRRGRPELDVDAELSRLRATAAPDPTPPDVDPQLREEIRELVIARERRRARRANRPVAAIDVDAEVAREIARLAR